MSRRRFLGYAGMGAAGLGLSGLLAACGGTAKQTTLAVRERRHGDRRRLRLGVPEDDREFTFGNWPLYIDQTKNDGERVHPSLELFQKEKGITVDYKEVIQAYDEFFAKLRILLEAGQPTGYDLIVMGYPKLGSCAVTTPKGIR